MSRTHRLLPVCFVVTASFATAAVAAPIQWRVEDGGNGHYYDYRYVDGGILWPSARDAAAGLSHAGRTGHLATITSAAEQAFVASVAPATELYLGGFQAPDSAAPDQGWSWITGEPWQYTAWGNTNSPAEPTDGIGFPSPEDNAENYLSRYDSFRGHGWNDVGGTRLPTSVSAYMVEFPAPVPEPSAAALSLCAGGVALLRRCRRTRGTRR